MTTEYLELNALVYVRTRKGFWKPRYVALRMPNDTKYSISVFKKGATSESVVGEDITRHYRHWLPEEQYLAIQKLVNQKYNDYLCGEKF